MNYKTILRFIPVFLAFVCVTASAAFGQATAITYQGKLTNGGSPANGSYEMQFTLFDQAKNGFEIGTPKAISNIPVTNGIFTVRIDMGDWIFDQGDRFMEIAVRPQGSANPFTALAPLQEITLAPKAAFSNASVFAQFSASSGNAINLAGLGADQFVQKNANGEIVAPRFENLAGDPAPASAANIGQIYFNTITNGLRVSNGVAWVDLSPASRQIQSFTGVTASSNFNCTNTTTAIRTATFTKSSAATRLRITFKDTASAFGPNSFTLFMSVRIDGVLVSNPTALRMASASSGENGLFFLTNSFTSVGYADGVSAGTHSLTTTYSHSSLLGGTFTCIRET
ncbi:MAG TPA: hypothetical protein VK468_01770, partial [Pyrinomonadaceae bacterium]|nr:hypothetical protein [Pyrinomonadaceae bacterium]